MSSATFSNLCLGGEVVHALLLHLPISGHSLRQREK